MTDLRCTLRAARFPPCATAAPKERAARTSGCTLAGGPPEFAPPTATSRMSSPPVPLPAPLPIEIHRSAQRGELQKVIKWLRKGGTIDALGSTTTADASTPLFHNVGHIALRAHKSPKACSMASGSSII